MHSLQELALNLVWERASLLLTLACALAFCLIGWAPLQRWTLRRIPGPFALPFIGHLPDIASKDMTFFFHEVAKKYGSVVQVWLGARPWILVSDPSLIRKIAFKFPARPLSGSSFSNMLVDEPYVVDKESIIWHRGNDWKASRRAFESSIIHPEKLRSHEPAIRRCIDRFLRQLDQKAETGEGFDIKKSFTVFALAVTGEVAYGVDFCTDDIAGEAKADGAGQGSSAELMKACYECVECLEINNASVYLPLQMMLPALRPLWVWMAKHLPDSKERRHMRARQTVADVSRRLMERWQRSAAEAAPGGVADDWFRETGGGINSSSFLATMMGDRQQQQQQQASGTVLTGEPARLDDIQVIAQGLTFILAGYETSSTSLANVALCLASVPEVQEKLRQELRAALPNGLDGITLEDLCKLPYLDAVVQESQRMYPAATFLLRDVMTDVKLDDGLVIPRGSIACCSIYNAHHDPKQWTKPETFLPERFLEETKGALGPADPNAFIPFGMGARMCVGYKLANMSIRTVIAVVILRYRLELHPSQTLPARFATGLTMAPADGVWVGLAKVSK